MEILLAFAAAVVVAAVDVVVGSGLVVAPIKKPSVTLICCVVCFKIGRSNVLISSLKDLFRVQSSEQQ